MNRFLRLSRAPFFAAVVTPMLVGSALAYATNGSLDWLLFALTLLGLVAAQAGINLFNDYYDHQQGADQPNRHRSPFNGGSPDLVDGSERPASIRRLGVASFLVAAACGGLLAYLVDGGLGPVVYLAVAGFIGGYCYTAPPLRLAYRGLGELAVLLCFGPLPVLGAYYVQTGSFSLVAVAAAMPVSFLITNVIWVNQFPDHGSDKACGKHHWVVRLGLRRARWGYAVLGSGAFATVGALGLSGALSPWILVALIGVLPAVGAARLLYRYYEQPPKLVPAQGLTVMAHMLTGCAMAAALVAGA